MVVVEPLGPSKGIIDSRINDRMQSEAFVQKELKYIMTHHFVRVNSPILHPNRYRLQHLLLPMLVLRHLESPQYFPNRRSLTLANLAPTMMVSRSYSRPQMVDLLNHPLGLKGTYRRRQSHPSLDRQLRSNPYPLRFLFLQTWQPLGHPQNFW